MAPGPRGLCCPGAARPPLLLLALIGGLAVAEEVTPVGKVVRLLATLQAELQADGEADGRQYIEFSGVFQEQKAEAEKTLAATQASIEALDSDQKEQEAFREGKSQELTKAAAELVSADQELQSARSIRGKERRSFEATEADLLQGVDQLSRSVQVLEVQAPAGEEEAAESPGGGGSGGGASLLSVAQQLQNTLLRGKDISLSALQRATLDDFLRTARSAEASRSRSLRHGLSGGRQALAPDFLQLRRQASSGPFGEYTSQTSGVLSTLRSVLDKADKQLEAARSAERLAQKQFEEYASEIDLAITNKKKTVSELKMQISQSQERSGKLKANLLEENALNKVAKEQLSQAKKVFAEKSKAYKVRLAKRSDEVVAVREASALLTSDEAQRLLVNGTMGTPDSFLQIGQATRRRAIHVVHSATTPGLALLALRTQTHTAAAAGLARASADPFAKVKVMVRGMLEKLMEEQSRDATHAAWCSSEMAKTDRSKRDKEADVQKLKDRMDAMTAEIQELANDVQTVTEDLHTMQKAGAAAVVARQAERQRTLTALAQYKDAHRLLEAAIATLRRVYGQKKGGEEEEGVAFSASAVSGDNGTAAFTPATPAPPYKVNGAGSGVIGILEIALQDYADLRDAAELEETVAQKDFKELMDETEVRTAAFQKDLEYKSRGKVKLEGERMRASSDLKNYEKELEAVDAYLLDLQASCVAKTDSYQVRKTRREEELRSLQEALEYLEGEGTALL